MPLPRIVNVAEVARAQRKMRHPQHPFQVAHEPWQIQPFFIAPVLPGETLKSLRLQARAVTDPIKNPLVGWWIEYYFYYVKLRDLGGRDDFANMMLDPTQSLSSYAQAATPAYFHAGAGISWVLECLKRVVEVDFRQEGEAWNAFTYNSLPAAQIMQQNALQSAMTDTARAAMADVDVDLDSDSTITASEVDKALYQWQLLRTQGMANMSFEDYLASYGVRPKATELHFPELVRYVREWTYPTNTVDPSDGSVASACSWKIQEGADKDRYFSEPGFLFGCSILRPKVYLSKYSSTLTDLMTNLYTWLPAVLRDDVNSSFVNVPQYSVDFGGNGTSTGPADSGGWWLDIKDLFLYGEQYVNFALSASDKNLVALPASDLKRKYASTTDGDALFTSSAATTVRQDGIVSLSVASSTRETSQPTA